MSGRGVDAWRLPSELVSALDAELRPGERVVWAGRPKVWRAAIGNAIIPCLFGIPFLGFAIFWTSMAIWIGSAAGRQGPDGGAGAGGADTANTPAWFYWGFPLFGIPFILIGAGLVSSPYWAARRFRRTVYAVTDRRAVVLASGRTTRVRSWEPDEIRAPKKTRRADGSGDLLFVDATFVSPRGGHVVAAGGEGFFAIEDVDGAETAILALAGR